MGNQPAKQPNSRERPKKNVHWKSAEPPSPPGKPIIANLPDATPDIITLRWDRPPSDGGSPIIGYFIEHRRTGSPHWIRATPSLILSPELSLSGLEPGWRYQFRIIAANVVGPSEPSDLSETLTVTLHRNAITSPRFTTEIEDQTVVENEKVSFYVAVDAVPTPQVNWFKDGFEVFSSRRTKIINEMNSSTLIIHQAALTDEGEIKCTATNRAGHVASRAQLKVEAPPKIRLPRQYEDGLLVEADEVIRLKVGIAGRPFPSIVWSHNGEIIPNGGRYELLNTDKNSSLKISNAQRTDRGEYHLKAINKLGEDSVSFLLTVTARPSSPGNVIISAIVSKSVTLNWSAPKDDGGCIVGNYIIEYFRIGWNVWLKAITTRQLTATLNDLIEGSEYRFRVKAESPYGLSDPSEESETVFIPDPKRGITKPLPLQINEVPKISLSQQTKVEPSIDDAKEKALKSTSNPKLKSKKLPSNIKVDRGAGTNSPILNDTRMKIVEGKLALKGLNQEMKSRSSSPMYENVKHTKDNEKIEEEGENMEAKRPVQDDKTKEMIKTRNHLDAPRDNHDEVHTSNEFMLVLYDDKKTLRDEKDQFKDSDEEDINIPPPLSLSAPELGTEFPPPPILRHCVSSTEILFEKAMQRVYQTMQYEESQSKQDKQLGKKLNTNHELIPNIKDDKPDLPVNEIPPVLISTNQIKSIDNKFNLNEIKDKSFEDEMEECKTSDEDAEDELDDEDDEDEIDDDDGEEEEERDLKQEILQSQKMMGFYRRPASTETPQSSVDFADDYTDSTASSASSLDSLEKFIVAVKSVKKNDNQELETYHPHMGSNLGISAKYSNENYDASGDLSQIDNAEIDNSTSYKNTSDSSDVPQDHEDLHKNGSQSDTSLINVSQTLLSPSDAESSISDKRPISPYRQPDSDQSTIELNRPLPLPDPNFVPKPILKRSTATENGSVNSKQTGKLEKSKPEKRGIMQLFSSKKSNSNSSLTSSQDKLKIDKKPKENESTTVAPPVQSSQKAKAALMIERRQSSIEENKVAIDYYSDIVKEHGIRKSYSTFTSSTENCKQSNENLNETSAASTDVKVSTEATIIKSKDTILQPNQMKPPNVPKTKSNESYSRSIFAIKLSKEQKKSPILAQSADSNQSHEKDTKDIKVPSTELTNTKQKTVTDKKEKIISNNMESIEIPKPPSIINKDNQEKTATESRGRSKTVGAKKKQIRNRSRSNSTTVNEQQQQQQSSAMKTIKMDSSSSTKSTSNKNRKILHPTRNDGRSTPKDENRVHSPDIRCQTPEELLQETTIKVKTGMAYLSDLAMFCVACWVYAFKDARWAIPILGLIVYRQLMTALKNKCPKWIKLKKE